MRYGVPGNYNYAWARNMNDNQLACDHNFLGDAKYGQAKDCEFSTFDFYNIPTNNSAWSSWPGDCKENMHCVVPNHGKVTWLRYGANGKYIYTPVSGEQKVVCSNTQVANGEDPHFGVHKTCQFLNLNAINKPDGWGDVSDFTLCANEGQSCSLPSRRATLVRYGAMDTDGRYRYSTKIVTQDQFTCSSSFFGVDPFYGTYKHCDYLPIDYSVSGPNGENGGVAAGKWIAVADNGGSQSKTITKNITVGASSTDTDSTSNDWSATVTRGVEVGMSIEDPISGSGTSVSVSTEISASYANSTENSYALSLSQQDQVSVSCSTNSNEFLKMWRFETDVSFDNCLSEGVCSFTVQPLSTYCTTGSTGYKAPKCVPGYCADDNCQVCNY